MNLEEALKHFPVTPSPELIQFTDEMALADAHYLFIQKQKKNVYEMFCTRCNTDTQVEGVLSHNEKSTCPNCGIKAKVKQAGRGRNQLVHNAYVEFAERSLIDPEAITISRYYATRNYSGAYRNVATSFQRLAMYIYKPGESYMFSRTTWNSEFDKRSSVYTLDVRNTFGYSIPTYVSMEQLRKAIQGTPFQYSMVDSYDNDLVIAYLALYCKYPYIEALTKIGLQNVIIRRLLRDSTKSINWRGKTLDKIIGLPKYDWKHFRLSKKPITEQDFLLFKKLRKFDQSMPALELLELCMELGIHANRFIETLESTTTTIPKAVRYLRKQMVVDPDHFNSINRAIITWRDYIDECIETNVDISKVSNLYPRDLYQLHQEQIKRKKILADIESNIKAKKRYEELMNMTLEDGQLLIRPFMSAQEIVDEGNQLEHCIGGYVNKHVDGFIDLFTIRLLDQPDKPYYSVEIKNEHVIQVRGLKNKSATEEVEAFVDRFKREILAQRDSIINKAS